jgi:hypothetical protein
VTRVVEVEDEDDDREVEGGGETVIPPASTNEAQYAERVNRQRDKEIRDR